MRGVGRCGCDQVDRSKMRALGVLKYFTQVRGAEAGGSGQKDRLPVGGYEGLGQRGISVAFIQAKVGKGC